MEYLYLKWISNKTVNKHVIGALCRKDWKYYFKLVKDYSRLKEKIEFPSNIIPFSDENRIYESNILFAIFRIRLPDITRYSESELNKLLEQYKLDTYDEFKMLKATSGKLRLDNFIVEGEL